MASMYCWPSVSIKRGASLVIARKSLYLSIYVSDLCICMILNYVSDLSICI